MRDEKSIREKRVSVALGIAMVEGQKPSPKATNLTKQYIEGKLTAEQIKN